MPEVSPASGARAPNPLLAALGRVLEAALNRLVDLDAETKTRIGELDGRDLSIDFKNGLPAMRIRAEGGRLRIGPALTETSALRITATPGSLLSLALSRGGERSLPAGRVEIAGDAEFARRIEQMASRFAPDFDEAFARVFGDTVGFQIARALRDGLAWSRRSAKAMAGDVAEYLTEEGRDLVARGELERFLDDVDALRERGDRLEARVRRLAARHGTPRA